MALPSRIGRYPILELLGRGAMGVVYRGRDEGLDRDVAVKVVRAESLDDASRAQFLKEARAAARLQHPGIVTIYELGEEDGTPYLAMELLNGQDLQRAMREGALRDPAQALGVLKQVLAALGHAHERGIVHRDMKPSNVFLHEGARAKILDFGVARLGEGLTQTGRVVGTPHYMSPEQIRADKVDGRADLFSVALMYYEMVTGTKAYRPGSDVSVMFQIVHEDPDLSRLPPTAIGAALRRVLRRALARDRDERYPDAAALAVALTAALETPDDGSRVDPGDAGAEPLQETLLDVGHAPAIEAPRWALGAEPTQAEPRRSDGGPLAEPRSRGPWMAAAALLAGALGAGTWWWVGTSRDDGEPSPRPRGAEVSPTPGPVPVAASSGPISPPSPLLASPPASPSLESPTSIDAPTIEPRSPTIEPHAPATSPASPLAARPPVIATAAAPPVTRPTAAPPLDPQVRLDRANRLFEQGQLAAALAEARAVLRVQPDNTEAKYLADDIELDLEVERHLKAARAALARGDRAAARREAEAGLHLKPNESRLGALLRELERP